MSLCGVSYCVKKVLKESAEKNVLYNSMYIH